MMPAPMPVPTVKPTMLRLPFPAPHRASPSAAASASFSRATVTLNSSASSRIGFQPCQPGSVLTSPISPVMGSMGPVHPMPIPIAHFARDGVDGARAPNADPLESPSGLLIQLAHYLQYSVARVRRSTIHLDRNIDTGNNRAIAIDEAKCDLGASNVNASYHNCSPKEICIWKCSNVTVRHEPEVNRRVNARSRSCSMPLTIPVLLKQSIS